MKIKSNTSVLIHLFIAGAFVVSCQGSDKEDEDPTINPVESEEGYATGRVTDTNGNPIAGAEVRIDNTMFHNSNIITNTNNEGFYKAKLATVGTYNVTAVLKKEMNGMMYNIDLHPDQNEVMSNAGGTRNLQLKLTGKKADGLGYYGGTVSINAEIGSHIYDSENITFTLVPVGRLLDGNNGQILMVKEGAAYTQDYGYLVDIPLGRYKMSAMYATEDGNVPLRIRKKFDNASVYTTDFTLDFEPGTHIGKNMAIIEYDYSE